LCTTAAFAETYARAAIDAGAQVAILQGSHAPMRGIEIYRGRPIFYDPGDLCRIGPNVEKQPADAYTRWGYGPQARKPDAGPPDVYAARDRVFGWGDMGDKKILSPKALYSHEPGFFVPVCHVGADYEIKAIDLHPATWLEGSKSHRGLPALARGAKAAEIIDHLAELSSKYGTTFAVDGETAHIDLSGTARVAEPAGARG
jgi:poly-gamma-glutamate synthesis protein (capsule biosynthesis protein)